MQQFSPLDEDACGGKERLANSGVKTHEAFALRRLVALVDGAEHCVVSLGGVAVESAGNSS